MSDEMITPLDVLDFWWLAGPSKWFSGDAKFDVKCRDRFQDALEAAKTGALDHWRETADGSLALLLLLDQMSRNIYRGTPEAFSSDPMAVSVATEAMEKGFDRAFPKEARGFFYLPFEHSEDMAHQEKAVDLGRLLGDKEFYHYALIHMDVIRRFGRFPHRNKILGRESTPDEDAFLKDGGFSA